MYGTILIPIIFVFSLKKGNSKNSKDILYTSKGKEEIKKCLKLKKFMQEYTLLKARKPEEISIYELYIPYAITLGVNNNYKNTIYDVFEKTELKNILQAIKRKKLKYKKTRG